LHTCGRSRYEQNKKSLRFNVGIGQVYTTSGIY
ncbi:MAG: hypothetical protein ACI8TA_003584, partial [Cyclobacteriaceae bacterium]